MYIVSTLMHALFAFYWCQQAYATYAMQAMIQYSTSISRCQAPCGKNAPHHL